MSPLSLLPTSWLLPAAAIGAGVMAVAIGVQTMRLDHAKTELAEQAETFSEQRLIASRARAAEESHERDIEQARAAALQEAADEATRQLTQARADAFVADAASGRLQQRVAALVAAARQAGGHSQVAGASPPTDDPAAVLADMQLRADETAGELARIADERGVAGAACERAYDALTASTGYDLPPAKLGGP